MWKAKEFLQYQQELKRKNALMIGTQITYTLDRSENYVSSTDKSTAEYSDVPHSA